MPLHLHRQFHAALLSALFVASTAPALADPPLLPPLLETANAEHHVGKVILVQLVTPDLASAKKFYSALFNWTFRDVQAGGIRHAEALHDGQVIAGLVQKDLPPGQTRIPAWMSFLAVRDVDALKKAVVQNGGRVLSEPQSFPNRGRQATFADPQGATFSVLASTSGDPPEELADPGEWIWSSLLTSNADSAAAFYQTLFDYEVFDLPAEKGHDHLILAAENLARASVNSMPVARPDAHPHWLNFMRVENTTAMIGRVVSLGGHVLVAPRPDRHGGLMAVVSDPQGAIFGLLEWPDGENKQVNK